MNFANKFAGKNFIVTGGSSGIGRALALELNSLGAKVTTVARRADKLADLRSEASGRFPVQTINGDVTDEKCIKDLVRLARKNGIIDYVVHNAGTSMRATAAETDMRVFYQLMEINYFALVRMYKETIGDLILSAGSFVAVGSMMAHYSTQVRSGYAASKHAMLGFIDSVRLEHLQDGVHFMTAAPGFVKTEVSINALNSRGERGENQDTATENGIEPGEAVREILIGIAHRKRDVFPSAIREKAGLVLSKIAPSLLDEILAHSKVI